MTWFDANIEFISIFGAIVLFHLLGEFLSEKYDLKYLWIRYITKPLIIPFLILFYISSNELTVNWWVVTALLWGFLGDVFLMIPDPEKKDLWLRAGLISFLFGHVLYIIAFIIMAQDFSHFQWWSIFLAVPFVICAAIVQPKLTKHTGDMTIAVTVYIFVITFMGISTTFLLNLGTVTGFILLYIGAWVFLISDILNGIGRFVVQFKYERIITMFTYVVGQLLIVLGLTFL